MVLYCPDGKLLIANTFNDIKEEKYTEIEIGSLSDYSVNCWTEAISDTYLGGPSGIITKIFLDMDGTYQIPEITLVKTLSAKEALSKAKEYTDEQLAELKSYIDSKLS